VPTSLTKTSELPIMLTPAGNATSDTSTAARSFNYRRKHPEADDFIIESVACLDPREIEKRPLKIASR